MFNSAKPHTSSGGHTLVDTDTIELFSKDDLRLIRHPNRLTSGQRVCNLSIGSIILLLVIAISTVTLIRFCSSLTGHTISEPLPEETINSSDIIFNYEKRYHKSQTFNPLTTSVGPQCLNVEPNARLDCNPDQPINKEVCLRRGCCWAEYHRSGPPLNTSDNKPPLNVPFCYFGADYVGYEVQNIESYLYRTVVTLDRKIGSGFLRDSQTVKLEITEINDYSVRYLKTHSFKNRLQLNIPFL